HGRAPFGEGRASVGAVLIRDGHGRRIGRVHGGPPRRWPGDFTVTRQSQFYQSKGRAARCGPPARAGGALESGGITFSGEALLAVASAPAAFRIRVWQITSADRRATWEATAACPRANVAYAPVKTPWGKPAGLASLAAYSV